MTVKSRLLDQVREKFDSKNYNIRIKRTYTTGSALHPVPYKRHPRKMSKQEAKWFLSHLGCEFQGGFFLSKSDARRPAVSLAALPWCPPCPIVPHHPKPYDV